VDLQHANLMTRLELSNGHIGQMQQQAEDMVRKIELSAVIERLQRLEAEQLRNVGARIGYQPLINIGMVVVAAIVAAVVARYA
jgi:hypothetical protein